VIRTERGSATLLALAMVGLLCFVGAALCVAAAMVQAHRVAQSAADLAALGAAQAQARGRDPCTVAADLATANRARLDSCRVEGLDVWLQVSVRGPRWLGQLHDLAAQARAGPG
jgi:secretion/DNA translocation related TadE-like protein